MSGPKILVWSPQYIKSPFVHFSAFSNFFHHYYIYGEYPDCQKYKDWIKKCVAFKVTKNPSVKVSSSYIVHAFLYKQRFCSTQPQCCLTFSWIDLQMLLSCCLIHISIIILRYLIFTTFLFLSRSRSIYIISIMWSIFHFHLYFHYDY